MAGIDNEPIPVNNDISKENINDETKGIYKQISDINTKQQKIEQYFKNIFNNKKYDDEIELKKGLIQLLNDLINETSILSNDNRRYLYVLNYKIQPKEGTFKKLSKMLSSSQDKNLKDNEFFDDKNELTKAVSSSQVKTKEEAERDKRKREAIAKQQAAEFDAKKAEEITSNVQKQTGGAINLNPFKSTLSFEEEEIKKTIKNINSINFNDNSDVKIVIKNIKNLSNNVDKISASISKIQKSVKTSAELQIVIDVINGYNSKIQNELNQKRNDITKFQSKITMDEQKQITATITTLEIAQKRLTDTIQETKAKLQSLEFVENQIKSDQSNNNLDDIKKQLTIAEKKVSDAEKKVDKPGIFTTKKTALSNLEKAKKRVNDLKQQLSKETKNEAQAKSEVSKINSNRSQKEADLQAQTNNELSAIMMENIKAQNDSIQSRKSEADAQLTYLDTKEAYDKLSLDPSFTLDEKLKDIQYKSILIKEYSTKNLFHIDDIIAKNDYTEYINQFRKYIDDNNKGKFDLTNKDHDRSLFVKTYPIHQYFTNFNKNNGFQFNSVKKLYKEDSDKYIRNIEFYIYSLDRFLEHFENYINNWEIRDVSTLSIYSIFTNYWGAILTVIMIIILMLIYFKTFTDFAFSIYKKTFSFQKLILNDSMYSEYDDVYNFGGYYIDFKTLVYLGIYVILAILLIPLNLYNSVEVFKGNLKILGCKYIFNKGRNSLIFYGLLLLMFIIILNIVYIYISVAFYNTQQQRYDNHGKMQEIFYQYIDEPLSEHLFKKDLVEDNIPLVQVYEKLNNWAYNGTKEENDQRAGNNTNSEDLVNKRFRMLITSVICIYYINDTSRDIILGKTNLLKNSNFAKSSIFLYSKNDVTNNIIPPFSDFRNTKLFKSIIGPLPSMRNKKCQADDKRYFCNNDLYVNNIYTLSQDEINKIKDKYNVLRKELKEYISNIKETDNVMLYRVDVVISLLMAIFYFMIIIYIFMWIVFDIDLYVYMMTHKENIQTVLNVVIILIILIVIL